jgi:hypothetical protein
MRRFVSRLQVGQNSFLGILNPPNNFEEEPLAAAGKTFPMLSDTFFRQYLSYISSVSQAQIFAGLEQRNNT